MSASAVRDEPSVILEPIPDHPRRLTLTNDPVLHWWRARMEYPDGRPLGYFAVWDASPVVKVEPASVRLRLAHAQIYLAHEEVELLRPLTAHGLVIEVEESQA